MSKVVTIHYQKKALHFIGGPYRERIDGTYGVRLAPETRAPYDLAIDIPDYGVPDVRIMEEGLKNIIAVSLSGRVPYIGCMGGIGRTGMVLACLHRTLSMTEEDSLLWVRRVYLDHAVETAKQEKLIREFDVDRVRSALSLDPDGVVTFEEMMARTAKFFRDPFQRQKKPHRG